MPKKKAVISALRAKRAARHACGRDPAPYSTNMPVARTMIEP
jgi:hypothetical protein